MALPANKSSSAAPVSATKGPAESVAPPPKKKHPYLLPVAVAVVILINAVLFFTVQQLTKTSQTDISPTPIPTFTPTPTLTPTPYPLPQGKRSFKLNYAKDASGPKIEDITIDPFDPKVGENQTYTVSVSHAAPIKSIELSLMTDHKVATYSLQLVRGSETKGTWETMLTTDDTHLYEYYPYFIVKSEIDEFKGGLTLRAY